ncbi:MAG: hypothetical protein WCK65_11030 [Rhodospirillaceae bacterium]
MVSVPDTSEGADGACRDMVLPAVVAPVIDSLVAALANRDHQIKSLELRLGAHEANQQEANQQEANRARNNQPATALQTPMGLKGGLKNSLKYRLTGLLRRACHGQDVQSVLAALDDEVELVRNSKHEHHRLVLAGLERIFHDASSIVISSRHLIEKKIHRDGFLPREILLFIILTIATEKLRSGRCNDFSGGLLLSGRHLFGLWQYVSRELLLAGQITADEFSEARRNLEHDIGITVDGVS